MTFLGIETSCDETAIAVLEIEDLEHVSVRSNIVSSQIHLHAPYGGVVPALAAREHAKNIGQVLESALAAAGITDAKKEIDVIAVTHGPGLGPALLVGIAFAKTLAWKYGKPLIGTSHMKGHIFSSWLGGTPIAFPALNLIVSGGHTELVLMQSLNDFELIGETMDDAAGEAFDKVARLLGLGYPGGPVISKLATQGNPDRFPLPRPMLASKDFNFSYSGLKTAVLYLLRDLKERGVEIDDHVKKDVAASFQNAAIEVLIKKTIRAAEQYGVATVLLSGGVSANPLLREELAGAARRAGLACHQPPLAYTTDNAAMIALAGYIEYAYGDSSTDWQSVDMNANLGF
ncbi:MAG TPA: tRNA (adenosine(37)-N6)-threonylcarbamoyltransferase complex transferase subunit TsaD [Candidatus Paceibacterota bacterium]|nr:tRNA (adenosine(37)-N6)-threonylcarbamoyltransferase complex transferase subunit TsaD [Candidatus Paceibacterota bacterium]